MSSTARLHERPTGWTSASLGALADYINGYPFRPDQWKDHGTPIIRIAQMKDPSTDTDRFPGALTSRYRIDDGDLLFSWSATLMTLIWSRGPAYVNQHIFKVVPRPGVDLGFLHHVLDFSIEDLAARSHGTTMRHITQSDLLPFRVLIPPLPEQQRIAAILDTLDEVIRKTEDLIAKLGLVKQGLLHDLLTRGVEESGELRPSPDDAPQLYKDSPLGKVPSEWNVESIRSVSRGPGCYGSGAAALDYDPSLPRYVRITDITEDGRLSGATEASIRTIDADPYMLSEGDLLFARSGATVGKTHLYRPSDGPCAHAGYVIKYAIDTARAIPAYVFSWTQSPAFWRWIGQTLRQGAQPNINEKEYGGHLLALPPLAEQGRIVALLEAVTRRLAAELHEAEKLRVVKSGLLDDLLTGRVRVSVSAKTGA